MKERAVTVVVSRDRFKWEAKGQTPRTIVVRRLITQPGLHYDTILRVAISRTMTRPWPEEKEGRQTSRKSTTLALSSYAPILGLDAL